MEETRIAQLERQVQDLQFVINKMMLSDKYYLERELHITRGMDIKDGNAVAIGSTNGTVFGDANSKIGFFGESAKIQYGAITNPSGGGTAFTDAIDISGRTAIDNILGCLRNLGFVNY